MSKQFTFYSPHVREHGRTPENTSLKVEHDGFEYTFSGELKMTRLRNGGISVITVGVIGSHHFPRTAKCKAKVGNTRLKGANLIHFYEAFAH